MTIADTLTVIYESGHTETFTDATYRIDRQHLRVRAATAGERVIALWEVANTQVVRRHKRAVSTVRPRQERRTD